MATYTELIACAGHSPLLDRVRVACVIAADGIRANVAASAAQKAWAKKVFNDPEIAQREVLWSVLAQNKAIAQSALLNATDAQVQTAVDLAVLLVAE